MGVFQTQTWRCRSCGYEFMGNAGLYEADPNDFGTTHSVSPYYCTKCGNIKNVSVCISPEPPEPENEHLCVRESSVCENCGIEMQRLEKPRFKLFQKNYKCPKCGKKSFRFVKEVECWT